VVAVLWQNGNKSWFPARIGARVVAAYVEKKRRLAGNLPPEKAATPAPPTEVGAVWTVPNNKPGANGAATKIQGGHFLVDGHGIVAAGDSGVKPSTKSGATAKAASAATASAGNSPQLAQTAPAQRKDHE